MFRLTLRRNESFAEFTFSSARWFPVGSCFPNLHQVPAERSGMGSRVETWAVSADWWWGRGWRNVAILSSLCLCSVSDFKSLNVKRLGLDTVAQFAGVCVNCVKSNTTYCHLISFIKLHITLLRAQLDQADSLVSNYLVNGQLSVNSSFCGH